MPKVNPVFTTPTNTFKAQNKSKSMDNKNNKQYLETSLAGLAALGVTLAIAAPYTTKDIFKGLKANGLEIKNGFIISKSTGEKFTGKISYNSKAYGLEKETVSYVDGKTTEIVHHKWNGKEVNGLFFKNGKPFIRVGNITRNKNKQYYPTYEFDESGAVKRVADCFAEKKESVFDKIRKFINA